METVGIIPARGGSKGIKQKNIVSVLGAPLITHTIAQAKASTALDEVFVSTDSDEIADVSANAGAKVIERPKEIADDKASTESALTHALSTLRESGYDPNFLALLQCTSPLRRPGDIDTATNLVTSGEYDSALSCCEDHKFYWRETESGAEPINYDPKTRKRRQELTKRYQENGSIYVMNTDVLIEFNCRLGGNIGLYEMPEELSFEIDVPEDIDIVTSLAESVNYEIILSN